MFGRFFVIYWFDKNAPKCPKKWTIFRQIVYKYSTKMAKISVVFRGRTGKMGHYIRGSLHKDRRTMRQEGRYCKRYWRSTNRLQRNAQWHVFAIHWIHCNRRLTKRPDFWMKSGLFLTLCNGLFWGKGKKNGVFFEFGWEWIWKCAIFYAILQ